MPSPRPAITELGREGSSPDSAMKMGVRVKVVPAQDLWINVPSGKHVADNGAVIKGRAVISD